MGGRQIRPATVWKTKSEELRNSLFSNSKTPTPPWYDVLSACPPSETVVRPVAAQQRPRSKKALKPKKMFRPQTIVYPEDRLRKTFFKDHPWELARPRVLVETDGKDHQFVDWSKGLRQPGLPLTGESVVQRQLWRMENSGMSRNEAYDITRREFYRLRQEEEIERRVAKEEAQYVGAYFGKSRLDVGMLLEDQEYEKWKVWAGKEAQRLEIRQSQTGEIEYDDPADLDALDATADESEAGADSAFRT